MERNTKKIVLITLLIVIFMFGFSFALAPLYNTFCKLTGIPRSLTEKDYFAKIDRLREITIQFTVTNNKNLLWDFYPLTPTINIHPGEIKKIFFYAKNNSNHTITVQAIPSIAPILAIAHFHKIQCFCFEKQTLKSGESLEMPVVFKIDNQLPRNIHTITLAYTLFESASNQVTYTGDSN